MHASFQISIFVYFSDIYLGMQKEKGMTEDKMVGWYHRLDGQLLWVWANPGSLACYSPWNRKELDTTEQLNWTEITESYGSPSFRFLRNLYTVSHSFCINLLSHQQDSSVYFSFSLSPSTYMLVLFSLLHSPAAPSFRCFPGCALVSFVLLDIIFGFLCSPGQSIALNFCWTVLILLWVYMYMCIFSHTFYCFYKLLPLCWAFAVL